MKKKALLAIFTYCLASAGTVQGQSISHEDMRDILRGHEGNVEQRGSDLLEGLSHEDYRKRTNDYKDEVDQVLSKSLEATEAGAAEGHGYAEKYPGVDTIYFVSWAMGEESLKRVFAEAAIENDSRLVVIQGVEPGGKLPAALGRYYTVLREAEVEAQFVLDPSLFEQYGVSQVPTIVKLDSSDQIENGKYLASVQGLESDSYLNEMIDRGDTGDLGVRGNVVEISEPNLIDVMKQKISQVDWAEKKELAARNYWKSQEYSSLPPAEEDRVRSLDPSVMLTEDLKDSEGGVILEKGTVINPLEMLPFNRILIIFNPTRSDEVEYVERRLDGLSFRDGRVVLIASEFDTEGGWEWYENFTDSFDRPVYKLMPDVITRWGIRHTPTIITADDDKFIIEEVGTLEGQ